MLETRPNHLIAGAWAGLVSGIVFGIMVGVAGILPTIAKLIGSTSPIVGFTVQWVISVIVAVAFVVVFGRLVQSMTTAAVWGLIYGAIWWVLGPLVIMPIWLGAPGIPLFNLQAVIDSWPKLLMHFVYGLIVGVVYCLIVRRLDAFADQSRRDIDQIQQQMQANQP